MGTRWPPGTDPTPDPELTQRDLDAATAFMRFLAPPTPRTFRFSFAQRRGQFLFRAVGCASCHTPSLFTGRNPVFALSNRLVFAYSDFLLHDTGPELADICLGQAAPEEFRTAPLMGLRFKTEFLHDGRAASIDEAVRLHGGEASGARDRFIALSAREQAVFVGFLAGL